MSVIEINHLAKRFGDVRAVDDLSFAIEAGTVAGFLGPNGSGKTTTLRTLVGLGNTGFGCVRPNRPRRRGRPGGDPAQAA
jgi:ABC-2 type transport system ATP-binding protein